LQSPLTLSGLRRFAIAPYTLWAGAIFNRPLQMQRRFLYQVYLVAEAKTM